jgi:hypothetical protein
MRKIVFDEKTISEIIEFAKEHPFMECCNKFTLKPDTLHRLEREYEFKAMRVSHITPKEFSEDEIATILYLFEVEKVSIQNIARTIHAKSVRVAEFLKSRYPQEVIDKRTSDLKRVSKLGDKNPMCGKCGKDHHNYIGQVSDGKGYLMMLRPDWYTGRKHSKHVFVHSVVMCEHIGLTEIPKGFVVHHIDGNKLNNDIDNLALLTNGAHSKLHQMQLKMGKMQRLGKAVGSNPETPDNN